METRQQGITRQQVQARMHEARMRFNDLFKAATDVVTYPERYVNREYLLSSYIEQMNKALHDEKVWKEVWKVL